MVKVFIPQHNSETIFNATDLIYNATEYKLAHIQGKKKRGTGDTGLGIVEVLWRGHGVWAFSGGA